MPTDPKPSAPVPYLDWAAALAMPRFHVNMMAVLAAPACIGAHLYYL